MAGSNLILKARKDGVAEGRKQVRKEVLDWLEQKYMSENVVRKTPLAEGILDLARELSELMK